MSLPQTPDAWARLGYRIRAERERQGVTRKELADRAGVSPGSVQSAEKGAVPRGRWPQTLSAIEKALGWGPGSMRSVLEGGDVEYHPTLFDSPTFNNASTPAGGANHGGGTASSESDESSLPNTGNFTFDYFVERYGVKLESLPPDIAAMVPMVAQFSNRCLQSGASTRLVTSFDGMASIMLVEVGQAQEERARRESERTPEQLVADLEERQQKIKKEANDLRENLQKRLAVLKSAPPETENIKADIRAMERGIAEMDSIVREFSE